MDKKQWIVFKVTEAPDNYRYSSSYYDYRSSSFDTAPRPSTLKKPHEDGFLIWDEYTKNYSWVNKIEKATMFNEKKAKILASMYFGVADIHPKVRYA